MSYDEHGRVDIEREEVGPEWWAMGRELCQCGHHFDNHTSVIGPPVCQDCDACDEFRPLDNQ